MRQTFTEFSKQISRQILKFYKHLVIKSQRTYKLRFPRTSVKPKLEKLSIKEIAIKNKHSFQLFPTYF